MSKNISELSGRKGLNENLFEQIGRLAKQEGTPDIKNLELLADEFLIGKANVYGSASFYDFTRPENKGKKVYVCNGSACLTAGTQDRVKAKLDEHFGSEEIGEMCCLGRCHENSAFHYDGKNYSGESIQNIALICKEREAAADTYEVHALGTEILTEPFDSLELLYKILEDSLKTPAEERLAELKLSGLRGRGGAGFPMAFKLESCKNTPGTTKYVVCNADEGDPGAYSDRYLLEHRPHSVLLGMIITGYIIGANMGVLYIRGEYPESIAVISEAIETLRSKKLIGDNILHSGFSFDFKVIAAQGAYICGEETALLSSIEGQRPEVRIRPPYPAQQGLFNNPTVVNNVETLACVPWIMREGGGKFLAIGTGKSSGTKLVSLDGHFNRPGIYEVDMGTPLEEVVYKLGKGFKSPVKALHIGGPLGGIVPVGKIKDLFIDFESFSKNGFLLGHASVICIPENFPMIAYLEHLFQFTAHESCGKCFPCRLGSTRGYEMLHKARTSGYQMEKTLFTDLIETMEIGSLCALGGGIPLPVKNALQYFESELTPYFKS